jgi:lysophospholipase L1-like esterase
VTGPMRSRQSRREFLTLAGGVAGLTWLPQTQAHPIRVGPSPAGSVVLFQGDSSTDSGRNRAAAGANSAAALGPGYPMLVAAAVLNAKPDQGLSFFNRGVSGDKVPDLEARWAVDTLAIKPDVLSVLVGVNDFWHKRLRGYTGTVQDYENGFVALLESTRRALPAVRLVVLEPFVLRIGAVESSWFPEFDERRAAAARVARRSGAVFVELQQTFNQLAARSRPEYWAGDGVHPTLAGHQVIADRWRREVRL